MSDLPNPYDVQVGQIWQDADPRHRGKLIHILKIVPYWNGLCAHHEEVDEKGHHVRPMNRPIGLDRFSGRNNGYRHRADLSPHNVK